MNRAQVSRPTLPPSLLQGGRGQRNKKSGPLHPWSRKSAQKLGNQTHDECPLHCPLVCCVNSHSFLKGQFCKTLLQPRHAQMLLLCSHSALSLPLPTSSYFIQIVVLSSSPDCEFIRILEQGALIHDLSSVSSVPTPVCGTPGTSVCLEVDD